MGSRFRKSSYPSIFPQHQRQSTRRRRDFPWVKADQDSFASLTWDRFCTAYLKPSSSVHSCIVHPDVFCSLVHVGTQACLFIVESEITVEFFQTPNQLPPASTPNLINDPPGESWSCFVLFQLFKQRHTSVFKTNTSIINSQPLLGDCF